MAWEQGASAPSGRPGPQGLSMTVDATFFVPGAWTKGAILTGELHGNGQLQVGDVLACNGQAYEVVGIEMFKRIVDHATAGDAVGIALGTGIDKDGFEGQRVSFRARPSLGMPERSSQGQFVPSRVDAVVHWGTRKGRTRDWGILSFDGAAAALRADDGTVVFAEPCSRLTVSADSVALWVVGPDGTGRSLRGPTPQECRRGEVRALSESQRANVTPDPGLSGPDRWWEKLMITKASASLRWQMHWRRALVTMFEARGARSLAGGPDLGAG
jgi:hypothetical protein